MQGRILKCKKKIIVYLELGPTDVLLPSDQVKTVREYINNFLSDNTQSICAIKSISPFIWYCLNTECLRGKFTFRSGEPKVIIDPVSGLLDCSWCEDVVDELCEEFVKLLSSNH